MTSIFDQLAGEYHDSQQARYEQLKNSVGKRVLEHLKTFADFEWAFARQPWENNAMVLLTGIGRNVWMKVDLEAVTDSSYHIEIWMHVYQQRQEKRIYIPFRMVSEQARNVLAEAVGKLDVWDNMMRYQNGGNRFRVVALDEGTEDRNYLLKITEYLDDGYKVQSTFERDGKMYAALYKPLHMLDVE